jgi:hypothetical protein
MIPPLFASGTFEIGSHSLSALEGLDPESSYLCFPK